MAATVTPSIRHKQRVHSDQFIKRKQYNKRRLSMYSCVISMGSLIFASVGGVVVQFHSIHKYIQTSFTVNAYLMLLWMRKKGGSTHTNLHIHCKLCNFVFFGIFFPFNFLLLLLFIQWSCTFHALIFFLFDFVFVLFFSIFIIVIIK